MTIYIIYLILCLVFAVCFDGKEEKSTAEKTAFGLLCLYLICLSGFSYGLGGDKLYYLTSFESIDPSVTCFTYIKEQFLNISFMPLWSLLNYTIKNQFDSFYVLQFIESIVVNVTICLYVRKYTTHHFLFLFIYFISMVYFQFNTEVMREGFSIAFGIMAIDQFCQKKYTVYILLIALALMFHISAVILLLLPFASLIKIDNKHLLMYAILIIVLWQGVSVFLNIILPYVPADYTGFFEKAQSYSSMTSNTNGFIFMFTRYFILPAIVGIYILKQDFLADHNKVQTIVSFQILLCIIACIFGWGAIRICNYVRIFYIIWITEILANLTIDKKSIIIKTCTLLCIAFFTWLHWTTYLPNSNARFYRLFIPYTSFQDEQYDLSTRWDIYEESVYGSD